MTSSGLVNGQSEDRANGRAVAWVYDIGTGDLTFVDSATPCRESGDLGWQLSSQWEAHRDEPPVELARSAFVGGKD